MSRRRILWVSEEVPDRAGGGGSIRQAELLLRLGRRFDVDLLVAGSVTDEAVRAAVRSVEEVDVAPAPPPGRLAAAGQVLVRRRPLAALGSTAAAAALRAAVLQRTEEADLVLVHHENLLDLLDLPVERVGLHAFDVKAVRASQSAAVEPTWRRRLLWRAEAAASERSLRRHLGQADVVVACTAPDLDALTGALRPGGSAARGIVAPNGADLDRFAPSPAPGAGRVLFLGSLDYEPNVDAVTWFATTAWPAVRAAVPHATLLVAGHRPPAAVLALGALDGVTVVGPVDDAARTYAGCDVALAPLRVGSGSRVKVLEALASGRPVVGTTTGLEGLGLDAGGADGTVAADDPAGLADAVVALLRDPAAAAAAGTAGRAFVERTASWDRIADDLADALDRALDDATDADGVSVLVCTRGRPALLEASLRSLHGALGPADELLVVEADGSEAAPLVAGLGPAARHLAAPVAGKSRQLNVGLRAARHAVVVLTDDDCEVDPGWVRAMAAPFADPAVAVAFGHVIGLSAVHGAPLAAVPPGPAPERTWAYANGAAMAVRRAAVREVGGFDERLGPGAPVHGEEHDLVLRLQEAGWTVRIADAPPVRHLDWRSDEEERRNLLVYSRGAGAFVGAAVRRAPRRNARLLLRRARYQASLWRHGDVAGAGFGPRTTLAFVLGLGRGLALRPIRPYRRRASS
jgi:glycosyltransferase involved in cell wall biosynthesis/GT2 family glycosyltransferase